MPEFSSLMLRQVEEEHRFDADFYRPEYFAMIKKLKNKGAVELLIVATPAKRKFKPTENEFFSYIEISQIDLVTGEFDVSQIIGDEAPDRAQFVVKKDDILISTVRPIRNAITIIKNEDSNLVCSSGFSVIHPNSDPFYLFIYFKTNFVRLLLDRYTTATEYPAINSDDIFKVPIYLGTKDFRDKISNIVSEAFDKIDMGKSLYNKAEELLEKELGIYKIQIIKDLFYTKDSGFVNRQRRFDAEYFQPAYEKIIKTVGKKFELIALSDLIKKDMEKGIEVGGENYTELGKKFIRVSNISPIGFIEKDQKYISEENFEALKSLYSPEIGDLLITKDATLGIGYVVKETVDGIISSGILDIDIDETKINKEYVALCINSVFGRLQAERDGGGSIISHWRQEDIGKLLIPKISPELQKKIGALVQDSHSSRQEGLRLLNKAKSEIEKAVELN